MSKAYTLNLNGLVCPLPVARTKKKISEMESGEILEVNGDFGESGENIKRYIEKHGDSVIEFKIKGEDYYIKIKKA
ncbi:MAG: sulfurtransferase TusA family protein [Candidatus Lokiarchaeota archaeon]|nr:sulfurtransferase TusA family protein [Candidatus Lokiarchaeota archaeon]